MLQSYSGRSQSRGKYKSCKYCKKRGHDNSECYKLQNKEKRNGTCNTKGNKEGENSTNVLLVMIVLMLRYLLLLLDVLTPMMNGYLTLLVLFICAHIEIGLPHMIPLLLLVPFWVLIIHQSRLKGYIPFESICLMAQSEL